MDKAPIKMGFIDGKVDKTTHLRQFHTLFLKYFYASELALIELAALIGADYDTVKNWNAGQSTPSSRYLRALFKVFGFDFTREYLALDGIGIIEHKKEEKPTPEAIAHTLASGLQEITRHIQTPKKRPSRELERSMARAGQICFDFLQGSGR